MSKAERWLGRREARPVKRQDDSGDEAVDGEDGADEARFFVAPDGGSGFSDTTTGTVSALSDTRLSAEGGGPRRTGESSSAPRALARSSQAATSDRVRLE